MVGAKFSTVFGELSERECEDCGEFIPLARIRAVKTDICVGCAEDREARGQGIKKHRMDYQVKTKGEEVEFIDTIIIRDRKG